MVMLQAETRAKASGIECMGVQRLTGGQSDRRTGTKCMRGCDACRAIAQRRALSSAAGGVAATKCGGGHANAGEPMLWVSRVSAETPRPAHENMSREHESQCKIRQPRALETKLAGTVTVITTFFLERKAHACARERHRRTHLSSEPAHSHPMRSAPVSLCGALAGGLTGPCRRKR